MFKNNENFISAGGARGGTNDGTNNNNHVVTKNNTSTTESQNSFPIWAIIVIAVFGFLLIISLILFLRSRYSKN
jgi:hypothetical protein